MILTMMMSTFERRRGVATPMIEGETETSNATVITDRQDGTPLIKQNQT
jgi:hypothetical protein